MSKKENEPKSFALSQKAANAQPKPATKIPPLPPSIPTTSRGAGSVDGITVKKKFKDHFYDEETKQCCGRTGGGWMSLFAYVIMYLLFLSTYTMIFLYGSLYSLRFLVDYKVDKVELLTYPKHGIGLTAAPTSESNYPLIWYKNGEKEDYGKYVQALDKLLSSNRRKREVGKLGPCGQSPYGYGEKPCVIVRINRQLKWSGQPLLPNSTVAKSAPAEVIQWMKTDKRKLWLECRGYHAYDKEHIGKIRYFPDPPGFDPDVFPLDRTKKSPLVAIQISDFSMGISLAVKCNLWYEAGPSTVEFVLYVAPQEKLGNNTQVNVNV
ncbi:sodium/potassium-transporting ATPase subunit beta-like [Trichoplusia ni]|uniref:Sodium/potassium-transporting ATPase subunit beta-like n=1 Tax=Trichoplusia ni TaxID=7111 RepID=A0A7E5VUN9_TRINI|nr:sodium/potassium-transporting ATPase subunit beta-like [Trichoplusia ni]